MLLSVVLELPYDSLLPLHGAKGMTIACLQGALWITQDGNRNDVVLEAGASFEVIDAGKVLVLALRNARFSLSAQFSLICSSRISLPNFS